MSGSTPNQLIASDADGLVLSCVNCNKRGLLFLTLPCGHMSCKSCNSIKRCPECDAPATRSHRSSILKHLLTLNSLIPNRLRSKNSVFSTEKQIKTPTESKKRKSGDDNVPDGKATKRSRLVVNCSLDNVSRGSVKTGHSKQDSFPFGNESPRESFPVVLRRSSRFSADNIGVFYYPQKRKSIPKPTSSKEPKLPRSSNSLVIETAFHNEREQTTINSNNDKTLEENREHIYYQNRDWCVPSVLPNEDESQKIFMLERRFYISPKRDKITSTQTKISIPKVFTDFQCQFPEVKTVVNKNASVVSKTIKNPENKVEACQDSQESNFSYSVKPRKLISPLLPSEDGESLSGFPKSLSEGSQCIIDFKHSSIYVDLDNGKKSETLSPFKHSTKHFQNIIKTDKGTSDTSTKGCEAENSPQKCSIKISELENLFKPKDSFTLKEPNINDIELCNNNKLNSEVLNNVEHDVFPTTSKTQPKINAQSLSEEQLEYKIIQNSFENDSKVSREVSDDGKDDSDSKDFYSSDDEGSYDDDSDLSDDFEVENDDHCLPKEPPNDISDVINLDSSSDEEYEEKITSQVEEKDDGDKPDEDSAHNLPSTTVQPQDPELKEETVQIGNSNVSETNKVLDIFKIEDQIKNDDVEPLPVLQEHEKLDDFLFDLKMSNKETCLFMYKGSTKYADVCNLLGPSEPNYFNNHFLARMIETPLHKLRKKSFLEFDKPICNPTASSQTEPSSSIVQRRNSTPSSMLLGPTPKNVSLADTAGQYQEVTPNTESDIKRFDKSNIMDMEVVNNSDLKQMMIYERDFKSKRQLDFQFVQEEKEVKEEKESKASTSPERISSLEDDLKMCNFNVGTEMPKPYKGRRFIKLRRPSLDFLRNHKLEDIPLINEEYKSRYQNRNIELIKDPDEKAKLKYEYTFVLTLVGLVADEKERIKDFATEYKVNFLDKCDKKTTHVVVSCTGSSENILTFNLLMGIALRKPIVSMNWVKDTLKYERCMPTKQYLIKAPGPLNCLSNKVNVFEGFAIHISNDIQHPATEDIRVLVKLCGAVVLDDIGDVMDLKRTRVTLVDSGLNPDPEYLRRCLISRIIPVNLGWLQDSIVHFQAMPLKRYLEFITYTQEAMPIYVGKF